MLKSVKKTPPTFLGFACAKKLNFQNYFTPGQTQAYGEAPQATKKRGQFQDREVVLMPIWVWERQICIPAMTVAVQDLNHVSHISCTTSRY